MRLSPSASTPSTKRLDRSGEGALNHFDSQAVEEALRVKEADGEGEVVLVSMGPARCARLAPQGACHGRRPGACSSRDDAAAGSDLVATSRALAKPRSSARAPDLVLFGQQASDSDGAVLWAAVADRLRRPVISQVAELTVADGKVRGKRQTEFGYDVIEAPLPAVVAVVRRDQRAALPVAQGDHGREEEAAGDRVRLATSASTRRRGRRGGLAARAFSRSAIPRRAATRKIEDDGSAAGQIVDFLAEKKLL